MSENIKIPLPIEFPLIRCKTCTHKFVLIGVSFPFPEKAENEGEFTWMYQANPFYCPYCGKAQK